MTDLTKQLEEALSRRVVEFGNVNNDAHIECINFHADRLAPLHVALLKCVEALEFECGGRCAPQNPCNAADVLADLRKALEECK